MSDLPLEQTWMVLVDLLTDLKKRGMDIPSSITNNIRLARSTINFYRKDPTNPEMMNELKRINDFLISAQDALINLAEDFGKEYVNDWTEKLMKASRGERVYEIEDKKSKFVVGAPPGFSMVRVNFKEPLAEDRVQEIAEEYNVIIEFDDDNVIAVYGDAENIKSSLKEISSFFKEQI
ncbi:MAG: DUF2096 domain-containing protein [Euryarchaeota archaeon]|nr:DUF2096 domain-containing protein [Euryarchaeota archaeon]